MKNRENDNFGDQCRALTKSESRCKNIVTSLTPVATEAGLQKARKTGWPQMVKGMVLPDFAEIGLCRQHLSCYFRRGDSDFLLADGTMITTSER